MSAGDARTLLNALELAVETTPDVFPPPPGTLIYISKEAAEESIQKKAVLYDKEGDYHFDVISAFIKSLRGFSTYIKNSIITSTLSAFIKLGITTLAAYAFSHWKFRGKRACAIILLSTLFIPSDAILYENFTTISKLGLLDSYIGIILPGLFSASSLLLLSAAFYSLDKSYYDAAEIDGCSDIQYILYVLLPLTEAVAVTIFLQTFISTFNSYLWPLLVTNKKSMRTIQIAISLLGFGESGEYGAEMMSILIISLPFIIILALSRKKIEKALMNGYIHS